ncbi:MAG: hypothetical protein ACRCWG_03240 [Sarcina sp.]
MSDNKKILISRWILTIVWVPLTIQQIKVYGFGTRAYWYIGLTTLLLISTIKRSVNIKKSLDKER